MQNFVTQLNLVQWFESADKDDNRSLGYYLAKLWWVSGFVGELKCFVAVMIKFRVNDALLWVVDQQMDAESLQLLDRYLLSDLWHKAKNMDSEAVLSQYYNLAVKMQKYGPNLS